MTTVPTRTDARPPSLFGRSRDDVERALPALEVVRCPLCDSTPRTFGVDFQGRQLARCRRCRLEWQSPRPTFEQLRTEVYGDSYHPVEQAVVDAARGWHYARQLRHLARLAPSSPGRLLDVGCGVGAFLRYAGDRGWEVEGSDVVVTEHARRTEWPLHEGQLPDLEFGDARYDVVRFNQVLEHTQDPLGELRAARRILSPGGVLLVGVPNMAGLSIRTKSWQSRLGLKRRRWKHYGALHHLWFFRPRTLAALARAAGFEVVRWETPVATRPGRPDWLTQLLRGPMQGLRLGGILDLYARTG